MPFVATPLEDEGWPGGRRFAASGERWPGGFTAVPVEDDATGELNKIMASIPTTGDEAPEDVAKVRDTIAAALAVKNSPKAKEIEELSKTIHFGQSSLHDLGYANVPQPIRRTMGGALHGAGSILGPAARAVGMAEDANSKRELINKLDRLNALLDEDSVAGPLVGSVGQSLVQGTTTGPFFAAGYGAEAVDQALLEAKQKGMTDEQAFNHATRAGAIGYLFPKVGGAIAKSVGVHGGESLLPSAEAAYGAALTRSTLGKFLVGAGIEEAENVGQLLANNAEQVYSGVNPQAFDELPKQLLETTAASALGSGYGQAANKIRDSYYDFKESVPEIKKGEESGRAFAESEETTGRQRYNVNNAETQQDFYEATGIKRASKPFREAFKDSVKFQEEAAKVAAEEAAAPKQAQQPAPDTVFVDANGQPAPDPNAAPVDEGSSVKQAAIERDRELMGMLELDKQAMPKFQETLDEARATGVPDRALDIATDILANPRASTELEKAGAAVKMQDLKNQIESLQEQIKTSTDDTEKRLLLASQDRLQGDLDTIHKGFYLGGSKAGSQLNFQKLVVNKDFSLGANRARLAAARGDQPVTQQQTRTITGMTDRLRNNTARRRVAQANVDQMEAEEKASPLGKVLEDIGNFHRNVTKNEPKVATEIDTIAKEMAALASGAKKRSGEKTLNKRSNLERIKDLRDRIAALDTIDDVDRGRANKALDKLEAYYASSSRDKFIFNLERKFGRPFSDAERADLKKFYDQLGYNAKKRADKAATYRELQEIDFADARIKNDIQQYINLHRPRSLWQQVMEPFHFARAVKVAFDLPPVLRQGGFLAINPMNYKRTWNALASGYKAIGSEFHADSIDKEIKNRPNAPLYEKAGLFLHREDTNITGREESYMSKWAEKIPLFKRSQRGYTAFLNRLRADTFDTLVSSLTGNAPTLKESQAIANFVNVATGRGGLGASDKAMEGMSTIIFAPRYTLSRFQLAVGQPLFKGSMRTRKLVAQQYAGTLVGAAAVMMMANAAWGDREDFGISFDPDSPDFLKIKLGRRTRLDPFFGVSQAVRAMRAFAMGTRDTFVGNEEMKTRQIHGEWWVLNDKNEKVDGPYKTEKLANQSLPINTGEKLKRFGRTHLAPGPGLVADLQTGENAVGEKINPKRAIVGQFFPPLSASDVAAELKEEGFSTGSILGLLSLHGAGAQIYGPPDEVKTQRRDGKLYVIAKNDIWDKAAHLTNKEHRDVAGPYKKTTELRKWLHDNQYRRTESGSYRVKETQ